MNDDQTQSSPNTEPQLLLESGPMMIRDFNPKGILRFTGRKCVTCAGEILDHWLRDNIDKSLKGLYWCDKEGTQWSEGLTETVWDIPDNFGIPDKVQGLENTTDMSDPKWDE